jgi:hypothetical protein
MQALRFPDGCLSFFLKVGKPNPIVLLLPNPARRGHSTLELKSKILTFFFGLRPLTKWSFLQSDQVDLSPITATQILDDIKSISEEKKNHSTQDSRVVPHRGTN